MRLYTAHRNKAANTPLSDMERRAHSWDPSPAALARGRFEGCVGAMVRAFELPFAPATGITDLGGSVCQGGVRCPVTELCVVCVRRYHRAGFSHRLATVGAQRRGQRLSAATALWVDDALFWLGDEEESCFSEGATLPAEDMALLDVAFQYLGIGTTKGDGDTHYRKECSACVRAWARRHSRYIGAASRLRPCSAFESSSLS